MEILNKEVCTNNSVYHQLDRIEDVALYEQRRGGRLVAYEVIIVQKAKAEEIFGKNYPEREVYPRSELWGEQGWTHVSLKKAMQEFDSIVEYRVKNTQNDLNLP